VKANIQSRRRRLAAFGSAMTLGSPRSGDSGKPMFLGIRVRLAGS
jgi:hypothetical protein